MTEYDRAASIQRYLDAYNSFDIDRMMTELHQDIEFQNVARGELNATASGAAEFRAIAEQSKQLFSSRKQTVTRLVVEVDRAIAEIDFTGVLASDLPNGMQAGETIQISGRSEFNFRDDKIWRIIDYS